MRFVSILLSIMSCCSPAYAWETQMIGFGGTAFATSYLVSESFDTPLGYDLPWTNSLGTPNPDYVIPPAPLSGLQSLFLDGCAADNVDKEAWIGFTQTAGAKIEAYFKIRFPTLPSATASRPIARFASGATTLATFYVKSPAQQLSALAAGGTVGTTGATVDNNTTYHVWITYIAGSGANATATIAFSTTGVRPTSGTNYISCGNGTSTVDASRLYLGGDNHVSTAGYCISSICDDVRVVDAVIGDNPQ